MLCLFNLSWECAHWEAQTAALCVPLNDHKSTTKIGLSVTNQFQQIGKFINRESANNEDQA